MPANSANRDPSCRVARVAFGILTLIWAYNSIVLKVGHPYVDPVDFAAMRGIVGVVGLFVAMIVMRRPLRPQAVPGTILLGFLQITVFLALTSLAMVTGGAGKTAVLIYTMPSLWACLRSS